MMATSSSKAPDWILLVGHYQAGNVGDLILEDRSRALLQDRYPKAQIESEENTIVSFLSRLFKLAWARLNGRSTRLVFGGGSIFQDRSSRRSCWYYALLLDAAQTLGHDSEVLCIGFESPRHASCRYLMKKTLSRCTALSVRDADSHSAIQDYIAPHTEVPILADLAYYKPNPTTRPPQNTAIAISLKPSILDPHWPQILANIPPNHAQLGLCFDQKNDTALLQKHVDTVIDMCPIQREAIDPLPERLITMRYHAAVWASLHNIPFMTIGNDPKLQAIAQTFDQVHHPLDTVATIETTILNWCQAPVTPIPPNRVQQLSKRLFSTMLKSSKH